MGHIDFGAIQNQSVLNGDSHTIICPSVVCQRATFQYNCANQAVSACVCMCVRV